MALKFQGTLFQVKVWQTLTQIPKGKVTTYRGLAQLIKRPGSARAVGNALNANPYAPQVPCHRVVKSNGEIGGYAGGTAKKIKLLKKEGIEIKNNKVIPLKKFLY